MGVDVSKASALPDALRAFGWRGWVLLIASAVLSSCGGGSPEGCGARVSFNEIALRPLAASASGTLTVAVEIVNSGNCAVELSSLRIDGPSASVRPAARSLGPGEFALFEVALAGAALSDCTGCLELTLHAGPESTAMDRVTVPGFDGASEAYGRYPDATGSFSIYDRAKWTPGAPNVNSGPFFKLTGQAGFRPRDSSSNAALAYKGQHWIFGGWSNFGHDMWYSRPDVWTSADGVGWLLKNDTPPYNQYSSFVVFDDRMWALGPESYSSRDGVVWTPEPLAWSRNKRAVVFNNAIYGLIDSRVVRSTDGKSWTTLVESVPWGPDRKEPAFLVFKDRLWVLGGTTERDGALISYHNDVWSSADGIVWQEVSRSAAWSPRRWANAVVHEGKMFVTNGANHELWPDEYGNVADLWFSDDGMRWFAVDFLDIPWGARHASFVVPSPDGSFMLSSGYGHAGVRRIYNDVWKVQLALYFPKPNGDISKLDNWGSGVAGDGRPPVSFSDPHSYFVFRGRSSFTVTPEFRSANIVVGDGQDETNVVDPGVLGAQARVFVRNRGALMSCVTQQVIYKVASGGRAICK